VVLDAEGQPTPSREVRFVWDGHVPLHEVATEDGLTTWLFEPESFSPLAKEDATGRYAVVTDHLGAPTEMYDELGQLAWRMQLDAFGAGKLDVALQHCPWRWPGQYADEETDLLYNRFRYYDAYAGRYISQDPLGLAAGPSLYGYPEDPLSATDPLGLARSCKLRPYRGPGGGHHVPAKSAFIGAPNYDERKALAIPNDELARLNVSHGTVSGAQQTLYRAFAKKNRPLTWEDMSSIETKALVRGGMDENLARSVVSEAIKSLQAAGVAGPTRIPWG
jgi:RHS repeat-associated protein